MAVVPVPIEPELTVLSYVMVMPTVLMSFFVACEVTEQVESADATPVSTVVTLRPADTSAAALTIAAARRLRNIILLQVSRQVCGTFTELPSAADDSEVGAPHGD
ncbi:hypothetical protein GCM10027167_30190 [Nocardia heshunensis]